MNELVKAVYTPDDSLRLTLVYSSGKENTYDLLARSAFLDAVQNRLASICVGKSYLVLSFCLYVSSAGFAEWFWGQCCLLCTV